MDRRRVSILLACVAVLCVLPGCHCSKNYCAGYPPTPRPAVAPPCDHCAGGGPLPPRFNPNSPPVVPGSPPAGAIVPPPTGNIQQNAFVTPGPANPPAPPAGAPGVHLEAPEPIGGEGAGTEPGRPMPPAPEPPADSSRRYSPPTPETPSAKDGGSATPALPVDIPQFAVAKPNVASGQEPYPEGVAWLKSHGYRTVLHIRAPGADDREVRRRFEQSGLRYLFLEVSPQTLKKEVVDQFNRLVGDPNNQPLFVYDQDSSLAGGLWYLHFRLVEKASDEKARDDAAHLGFKQSDHGPHKAMWLAVQNFLATLKE
ncbi:MAG TPA: hypothetical protein VH643_13755 [Gemmataceae bacterium]|jgi:protein tyrosine phosphatase (PTP) superfamily phosphohydrolase (DUF442 family)